MSRKNILAAKLISTLNNNGKLQETSLAADIDVGGVEGYADTNALPPSPSLGDLALVTSTNTLYVYNGSAWFNIAIANQAPTAITGNEASYALAKDGTPTIVTLTSTDPEGFPLTWSSSVSGDTQVGTVVQADNVFTITPSTNEADVGTLSVTFSVTDGNNTENSTSTFTLAFLSPLWDETVLSIGTSSTNSLNNSTFIDRSTNAHTVTPTGSPVQTAFHPYLENWSVEFDGTGDYLRATDASLAEGTDDFTLECWFWMPSSFSPATNDSLFAHDTTPGYQISWQTSGFCFMGDTSNRVLNTNTLTTDIFDAWHHIAYTRVGDTLYGFLDGNLIGTSTHISVAKDFTNTTIDIGVNRGGTGYVNAYISNLRIVKGTALYTSAFTPPTGNLTAVSGTTLLTCQSNRFVDNSTNAHTITSYGNSKISASNPFGQESEYAVGENKGGVSIGSGNYLTTEPSVPATDDFTLECWIYPTDITAGYLQTQGIYGQYQNGGSNLFLFYMIGGVLRAFSGSSTIVAGTTFKNNEWYHIAMVRSSGSDTIYINGSSEGTGYIGSISQVYDALIGFLIVESRDYYFRGTISDLKVTNSALYTANFTPPTAPVGNTNADLYLPMDNAGIFDKTGNNTLTLVGNTSTSTTQTKFADTAMYFDGTGDYLTVPSSSDFDFGTEDFTIEMWIYTGNVSSKQDILDKRSAAAVTAWFLSMNLLASRVEFISASHGWAGALRSDTNLPSNQWVHIAVTRDGSTFRLFQDGSQVATNTSANSIDDRDTPLIIGSGPDTDYFNGYIENLQILKGVAKYTADFTPPTKTQGRSYQAES